MVRKLVYRLGLRAGCQRRADHELITNDIVAAVLATPGKERAGAAQ